MRRAFSDAMISGSVLLLLLGGLVTIDSRVREHVSGVLSSTTPAAATSRLGDMVSAVTVAARDQSMEHAPVMVFVGFATVLFLAMVRT